MTKNAKLLRIFVGEADKKGSIPIYEVIIHEASRQKLAGATVYKGIMGFGSSSRIHSAKFLTISDDLPLVIEIVDEEENVQNFIPYLEKLFEETNSGALITIEKAEIIKINTAIKS
ncbi:MAG: DUF190 domain-containing protein [Melioribacteraceae bacterium]|nr:DUF190 domain-containing protein [Melioribacteraceae bacterium]MCO6473887.1 DUF190 domain-containing protein [Melioribacteraceae bacterium]MDD3558527.1 DUF190 domain-containing protein [Melioribacteraceae bacterium]